MNPLRGESGEFMANLNDEFDKAAKELKEIVDDLKSNQKTKDALQELKEIKESGSKNLNEVNKFKEETKERISKSAVYDEEATNRSVFSLKSLFSCSGRLGKSGYVAVIILSYIVYFVVSYGLLEVHRYTNLYTMTSLLMLGVYGIFCSVFVFALIRRLHDCGKNGVPALLAIPLLLMCHGYGRDWHVVPLGISVVVALLMALQSGTDGDNAYGPIPPEYKLGSFIKNIFNAIRKKISFAISAVKRFLKGNAKGIAFGVGVITILSCIGIYLYIPKVSDVEEYQANRDINKLTQLINQTTEWQMFLDVRAEAIKALITLNDDKSEEFIERILHSKDGGSNNGNHELRDEVLRYCINFDNEFVIRRIDKYFVEILDLPRPIYFSDVRDGAYVKILHLASLSNNKQDKAYASALIARNCCSLLSKGNIYSNCDEANYLIQHIEKYEELLPSPELAKGYVEAAKRYESAMENSTYMQDTMEGLINRKKSLENKIKYRIIGLVVEKYGKGSYGVILDSGLKINMRSQQKEFVVGERISVPGYESIPRYRSYVDYRTMQEEEKLQAEIDSFVPRYVEWRKNAENCNSELQARFNAFYQSLNEYMSNT